MRVLKEAGWILVGQVASVFGALALVRILTEYLDPIEYGELALSLTIAGLVNQVVMGGITNGISRYYSIAKEKNDLQGYLKKSWKLIVYATLIVGLLALLISGWLVLVDKIHYIRLVAAILAFSIVSGYNGAINGIQNAARQRPVVAMHSALDAWLKIALAVGAILWLGASSISVALGYLLSACLITVSQIFFLRRLMRLNTESKITNSHENWAQCIWMYSWPFSVFGVFTWMQQASDRWALQTFETSAEVGQYVVVYQLGFAPIGMVVGLMMSLVAPVLYQKSGDAKDTARNIKVHHLIRRIAIASLMLTLMGFALAFLAQEWMFELLVAENYQGASVYFPWMVLAGGLFATGQMISIKLMSEIRSNELLKVKIGSSLIGLFVNFFGVWWIGISGAILGLVVFGLVYLAWVSKISMKISS
ncbi:MAG: lipopolysaccharide biosynthesis protein [Gallionella sp.]|nr:lipopolysaccharide biosynthesis protein [Gallionella sp.]